MKRATILACLFTLLLTAASVVALPTYTGFTSRSTGYVVTASDWNGEFSNFISHVNTYCIATLNLLLGKGRLLTSDGTNIAALTNSGAADDGKVLTLNSAATYGLAWTAPANQIVENADCHGRLTPFSGVPVATSTTSAASTIYFTPYGGNTVDLYESSQWNKHTFSEITISLSGLTTDKNFDVFIYDSDSNDTADAADVVEWTDDSTRATALATQDGVYVKTGATSRRYVGTFRTHATGETAFDSTERLIWNYYNRIDTFAIAGITTDSWTYASTSWRRINNFDVHADIVVGVKEDIIYLDYLCMQGGSGDGICGIGIDQYTSNDADLYSEKLNSGASEYELMRAVKYLPLAAGFHAVYPLEKARAGTITGYGDDAANIQTGLKVTMRM